MGSSQRWDEDIGRLDHDVSGMGLGSSVKSLYPLTCFGKALRCGGILGRYLESIPRCLGQAHRAQNSRSRLHFG